MTPMLITFTTASLSSKVEKEVNLPTRVETAKAVQRNKPALLLIQTNNKIKMLLN
jgi:biopolymer transport protein ExbD